MVYRHGPCQQAGEEGYNEKSSCTRLRERDDVLPFVDRQHAAPVPFSARCAAVAALLTRCRNLVRIVRHVNFVLNIGAARVGRLSHFDSRAYALKQARGWGPCRPAVCFLDR